MAWRNCLLLLGVCAAVVSSMDDRIMHPRFRSASRSRSSPDEDLASYWRDKAQNLLAAKLNQHINTNVAKNVIMFLGDGMSIPTLAAARTMLGQRTGESGEEAALSFEQFPFAGLSKTYCVDYQVADSACTSTAYLTGVKANEGTMGITAAVNRSDCVGQADTTQHVDSIVQWSQDAGKATGIITTARLTHASPGGGYAHIADRDWESDADVYFAGGDVSVCEDIASQLITGRTGKNVKVLMGGGRKNFLPNTTVDEEGSIGRRRDQRNLIDEWLQDKTNQGFSSTYLWNRAQLLNHDINSTDYLLGLFESDHMQYHTDANPETEPTLAEMTEVAIQALMKEPNGFFLFVEGARIDMGHHENRAHRALDETIEMAAAVTVATQLTSAIDTLIVVTADHAHTMSYSGYPLRGNDILGLAGKGGDQYPYTTLSYANGPGFHSIQSDGSRYNLTEDDTTDKLYVFPALNPLYSETHGGDDVAILSSGPWAHMLSGVVEQNYIPHLMAYASCVGDGATACPKKYYK